MSDSSSQNINQTHFSGKRVKKSFYHFFVGKSISAVIAFIIAILIIRELSIENYAYYTALTGLHFLLILLNAFGIDRGITKFIPEYLQKERYENVLSLLRIFFSITFISLIVTAFFVYVSFDFLSQIFNINIDHNSFLLFLAYLTIWGFTSQTTRILQAFLFNKLASIGISIDWFTKLIVFLIILNWTDDLGLAEVFFAQSLGVLLGLIFNLFALLYVHHKYDLLTKKLLFKEELDIKRVFSFSVHNYLQSLAGLHLQPSFGKLSASYFLAANSVAVLGFAYAITGALKRYLPASMFIGLIEPVLMGRYGASKNFDEVLVLTGLVLKLNLFVIIPAMVWIYFSGEPFLNLLSNGKYGDGAWLVSLMLFVLVLESHRYILVLVCNAVDKSSLLLTSNLLSMLFIPIYILLTIYFQLQGIILSLILVYWFRNIYVEFKLKTLGFAYKSDLQNILKIFISSIISVVIAQYSVSYFIDNSLIVTFITIPFSGLVYILLYFIMNPFTYGEKEKLNSFLGKQIFK